MAKTMKPVSPYKKTKLTTKVNKIEHRMLQVDMSETLVTCNKLLKYKCRVALRAKEGSQINSKKFHLFKQICPLKISQMKKMLIDLNNKNFKPFKNLKSLTEESKKVLKGSNRKRVYLKTLAQISLNFKRVNLLVKHRTLNNIYLKDKQFINNNSCNNKSSLSKMFNSKLDWNKKKNTSITQRVQTSIMTKRRKKMDNNMLEMMLTVEVQGRKVQSELVLRKLLKVH